MHLKLWHVISTALAFVLGTLLHFSYGWAGNQAVVGAFSPINESTWEHLKMLAFPMLFLSFVEYWIYGRNYENFIPVRLLAIVAGMATIVILYYTYTGILGKSCLPLDIFTFVAGLLVAYALSFYLLQTDLFTSLGAQLLGLAGVLLLVGAFVLFTVSPPALDIFRDPVTGSYGMRQG